ncbi:hypothetical protein ACET3Z_025895 [Daucus carota]
MISNLTEAQRKWIKDVVFTFLLDFELHMLPGKLSYNILQIFYHNTVSLKLKDAEIDITEEDVYDVFGMPHGGLSINLGTEEDYKERINAWHAQFNTEQVTAQKIVQAMKFQSVSDNFKLNFLVLMSNVLIGTTSCSYVDKQLLRFADSLDNLERYNWPEFLLGYLVFATESWNNTTSTFFRGSLIFLTLFYVDRVRNKGIKLVERQFPSYIGWTHEKLKERQSLELFTGVFGVGCRMKPLREVLNEKDPSEHQPKKADETNIDWDDWNMWKTIDEMEAEYNKKNEASQHRDGNCESDDVDNDNYQKELEMEMSQEDILDELTRRSQDILDAKFRFDDDMKKAREKFPESYSLKLIDEVMNENFLVHRESTPQNDSPVHPTKDSHPTMDADENQQLNQDTTHLQGQQEELVDDFERDLSPATVKHLEIVEQIYSTLQDGKNKKPSYDKDNDSRYIPSFSLGMHDEINEDVPELNIAQEQKRQKSTRFEKIGPHARSPYIDRVVDIGKQIVSLDFGIWCFLVQKEKDPP